MAMTDTHLRILAVGAHPDDPDIACGGTAIKWAALGHAVRFLSLTNGDAGHHAIGGVDLARRRCAEAQAAARAAGIGGYQVLDNHDGELEATLENRRALIRIVREFRPDLVVTHRPFDYHPDHRAAGLLVQDASYLLTVPNVAALAEIMPRPPVICYLQDRFLRPCPFRADMAVDIDGVLERKLDAVHCHASQVYEWLPFNDGILEQVPESEAARRAWLPGRYVPWFEAAADACREKLVEIYGERRGATVRCAEAFEVCEYGAPADAAELRRLFPV
jgi:N-acetylglucosamine malate deacetylase 1